ncbi:cytochrome C1, putative [Eimeria necatrix]|uniref:Cytochrome C1, putative n=1 Tax=Eimeria necatrix TaxID=51315 RepID=U6N0B1_9EIME|nr:cytochrome C1, putative [Eimeria necatrix]CDJ68179.1 cytochrome C1, putative [Eimeria necatrix]
MGGGGGGALNKLFPGYKDKIWMKVPAQWRERLVRHWNTTYERQVYAQCVVFNQRLQTYSKTVLDPLRPDEKYSLPAVDYKRQKARGTLVEGADFYIPDKHAQNRLARPFEPYTEEEQETRQRYKYQNLGFYLAVALGASFVHDCFYQRRPVCWCLEKEPPRPPHYPFWFKSIFHSHDIPSVRRGYEVYRKVCSTCHSMEQLHFRHLVGEVLPELRVKQIAAEYDVEDGPNDSGEMYTRPGVAGDAFPKPYPNEEAARFANNGAYPPDLSLITGARMHGPDYIMALLNGYHEPPMGVELRPGLYWNVWFPGNAIAMAPPLQDEMIEYEDGTPCNVSQMSKDVVNFLTWATEPTCDERKLFGLKAVSAALLGCALMTVWWRFFWVIYATRRIDFGKLKYL